jgi:hypothetical protein
MDAVEIPRSDRGEISRLHDQRVDQAVEVLQAPVIADLRR